MKATYELAMAAGRDAADRSMHQAGRRRWNEADWNAGSEVFLRVMATAGPGRETSGEHPKWKNRPRSGEHERNAGERSANAQGHAHEPPTRAG